MTEVSEKEALLNRPPFSSETKGITRRAKETIERVQEAGIAVARQPLSVQAMGLAAGGKLSMYLSWSVKKAPYKFHHVLSPKY